MTSLLAKTALLPEGWAENVLISMDEDGIITGVHPGKEKNSKGAEYIDGVVLPGMPNVHSHSFQRAMSGLTERAMGKKDNFWSWRETMYRFLEKIGPEEMEAIAAQLYVEMLKSGYTSVGEFHYIHHQQDGTPYENREELSEHIIQAALKVGIGITHMPVLYAYSGFGKADPGVGQKRFLNNVDALFCIIKSLRKKYKNNPLVRIGFAYHSLRAVSPEMMIEADKLIQEIDKTMPIHIHVAEQKEEVDNCVKWSGKRPVEWLLENTSVNKNWCIVHATHMTGDETAALAKTGAVIGICPTTEGNLGDGIFPMQAYWEHKGKFAIGSDSHISVSPIEELRWLEYMQRLKHRKRTIVHKDNLPSVGASLYESALSGGAQALGQNISALEIGHRADLIVLDEEHPSLYGRMRDHILDAFIFAGNNNPVKDVMVAGKWVVRDQVHFKEKEVLKRYKNTIKQL